MTTFRVFISLIVVMAALAITAYAEPFAELPDGAKLDLGAVCPICDMKLESSLLGPAAVVFKDGKVQGFDAAGDMFRWYLEPKKYNFDPVNIKDMYVTEYGAKTFMDAKAALYVTGSDLQQGMGSELAPFSTREAAEKFKSEHNGADVVEFGKVTLNDLKMKKKMLKMKH